MDVFFDDLKVTHQKSPIIQANDYYPFGLTFNGYQRENSTENRYLYNQGSGEKKFLTERIFDLGLNIDLTKYRAYDPAIGRWWQVDPLADEDVLVSLTPYNYGFNNPVRYNDPEGDCPSCIWGAVIGAAVDYGLQVAVNVAEGKSLGDALSDVDVGSIVVSAGAGALSGGISSVSKLKNAHKLIKAGVEVAVDASASAANQAVTTGEIDPVNLAIDVAAA